VSPAALLQGLKTLVVPRYLTYPTGRPVSLVQLPHSYTDLHALLTISR
jgi:hypothetical protein